MEIKRPRASRGISAVAWDIPPVWSTWLNKVKSVCYTFCMENKSDSIDYEDWFKKIQDASGVELKQEEKEQEEKNTKIRKNDFILAGFIFLLAFIPRIAYIFIFSNPQTPGWYTDVFHHWQIAFLSKEIGFSHGFLRLWDFKGMEYFWGLLHPLVLSILFTITGSISIVIPRLLSASGGSVSIVLLFFIVRRYFNSNAALAAAIFAAFFPTSLFSNTSGMQEELGMPLILLGILLWPRKPVLIGVLFALAAMVRAEYWLFSFGLVFSSFLLRRNLDKALTAATSYIIIILIYMKYLATWTGNYIYPIYWNFLASVKGEWFADLPIVGEKLMAKHISQGIFAFGAIGILLTIIKKPKYSLFFLFGFANILFIGFMVGFGSYVKGYIPRFWVDRLYNWPYLFTATLIIIPPFYYLPKKLGRLKSISYGFAWPLLIGGILISQLIWKPINYFMKPVVTIYNDEKSWAAEIAAAYQEGRVLLPEDRPYITYFLAHDYGISGKKMVGQMFDPFFYFPDKEDPFKNWGEDREKVLNWLKDNKIKLIALTTKKPTYLGLIEREPKYFELIPSARILLYRVKF